MKTIRLWLLNATTAISLLLCVATIGAWIFFSQHPFASSLQFYTPGRHDFFAAQHSQEHLHLVWTQGGPLGDSNWGWHISIDGQKLDVLPYFSFYEWTIPWWRLILLFLVPSFLKFAPWRSPSGPAPRSWDWLLHGYPAGLLTWRSEFKNLIIAHCLASYPLAIVLCVVFQVQNFGRLGLDTMFMSIGLTLLAPITFPIVLTMILEGFPLHGVELVIVLVYFASLPAFYLLRTDKLIDPAVKPTLK